MKLHDINSSELMPSFANDYAWANKAFDQYINRMNNRSLASEAPFTLEGIQALSNEELQEYYKLYSIAQYYPDIPRGRRDAFLFWQMMNIRKMGTIAAIEQLIYYINPDVTPIIDDMIAFDDNGNIAHPELLHKYRLTLNIASIDEFTQKRIVDNIRFFMRATAQLDDIIVGYVINIVDTQNDCMAGLELGCEISIPQITV